MGKTPKKKKLSESGSRHSLVGSPRTSPCNSRTSQGSGGEQSPPSHPAVDEDDAVFIGLASELKEEGTRLFQTRDYEGAAFKFDKAIKLLPQGHKDMAFLHCNIAACYMHKNPEEYHRAIDECNSALEASPTYTKALLKRARCFEALDRLDLACRDVEKALSLEPNNVTASELYESIKEVMQMEEDVSSLEKQVASSSVDEHSAAAIVKERIQRRVSRKFRNSMVEEEVWEMIHEEEEENRNVEEEEEQHEDGEQKHSKGKQEKPSSLQQHYRHPADEAKKHSKHAVGRVLDEAGQQHSPWATVEDMSLQVTAGRRHAGQDDHEKHLNEILVKGIQLEKGKHTATAQNQSSSMERRKKHFEVGSHSRQDNSKQHGNATVSLQGKQHSLLEDKYERSSYMPPEKQITTIKTANNCGREKHASKSIYAATCREPAEQYEVAVRKKKFKFVHGDDIRIVLIPESCSLLHVMDIARYKYNPHLKSFLLKFMDKEGDLVTITSTEDLRWVEDLYPHVPVRLHIKEVSAEREITRDLGMPIMPSSSSSSAEREHHHHHTSSTDDHECATISRKEHHPAACTADDWMVQFARLFKTHAGFDSDACVDLRDLGIRLYYEAMEDTITSEEAQEIFQAAEAKFQEMAALALFNWGNVHMSRARKRLILSEDTSKESILAQVKSAYEWACTEYIKAGKKFEDSVDVKPDFYEGLIALGQQQFEQAKLSWRYADTCKVDMGTEVLELFNHAEDNMEKGMEMWEGIEYLRVKGLSKSRKGKMAVDKLGLNEQGKDFLSPDEAFELASNMRSQLNISWGTILYERSVVEFKLGLSSWEESLQEAIEKFKTGGASVADISVMVKNHCVNGNNQEGLSFNIDEIVQAWNEMYDAKKLKNGSSSFRLEPIFRRRPSKLHNILEHMHYT